MLTSIFFKWVGSTTNQLIFVVKTICDGGVFLKKTDKTDQVEGFKGPFFIGCFVVDVFGGVRCKKTLITRVIREHDFGSQYHKDPKIPGTWRCSNMLLTGMSCWYLGSMD